MMTDAEILKKSIEKAVEGGWNVPGKVIDYRSRVDEWKDGDVYFKIDRNTIMFTSTSLSRDYIIFSPDFAKAFFKEVLYEEDSQATYNPNALAGKGTPDPTTFKLVKNDWKDRQHKMLDEVQEGRNPLQYLSEFLEEK